MIYLRLVKKGAVAQLVEHKTENLGVGGSIPPHSTKKKVAIKLQPFSFTLNPNLFI